MKERNRFTEAFLGSIAVGRKMMNMREVTNFVAAEPFQPFRLCMVSGETYEVRHRELVQVGRTTLTFYSALEGQNDAHEQWHWLPLLLVECIEPIAAGVR
jgi:hypothetical protein